MMRPASLKISPHALFTTSSDLSKAAHDYQSFRSYSEHIGNEAQTSKDEYSFVVIYFYPKAHDFALLLRDSLVYSPLGFEDPRVVSHESEVLRWLAKELKKHGYYPSLENEDELCTKLVSMWIDRIDIVALAESDPGILKILHKVTKFPAGQRGVQLQRFLLQNWKDEWDISMFKVSWLVLDFASFCAKLDEMNLWSKVSFADFFFNEIVTERTQPDKEAALADACLSKCFSLPSTELSALSGIMHALLRRSGPNDVLFSRAMHGLTLLSALENHHKIETEILNKLVEWSTKKYDDDEQPDKDVEAKKDLWTYPAMIALADGWAVEEKALLEKRFLSKDISRSYAVFESIPSYGYSTNVSKREPSPPEMVRRILALFLRAYSHVIVDCLVQQRRCCFGGI